MLTFKKYIENLWGEIPWPYKKPSDGPGGLDTNPSKTNNGASMSGGIMGMFPGGNTPMMMKKNMRKNMKKK